MPGQLCVCVSYNLHEELLLVVFRQLSWMHVCSWSNLSEVSNALISCINKLVIEERKLVILMYFV